MTRRHLVLAAVVACLGCQPVDAPAKTLWVADLSQSGMVISIELELKEGPVTGKGTLTSLTNVGGSTPLTYSGEQRGDSVDIGFARESGYGFRFLGAYTNNHTRLAGKLNGSEFNEVTAVFRQP